MGAYTGVGPLFTEIDKKLKYGDLLGKSVGSKSDIVSLGLNQCLIFSSFQNC